MRELLKLAKRLIISNMLLSDEIYDIVIQCRNNISNGSNESEELEKATNLINDLIKK